MDDWAPHTDTSDKNDAALMIIDRRAGPSEDNAS